MGILSHLIPELEPHLDSAKRALADKAEQVVGQLDRIGDLLENQETSGELYLWREITGTIVGGQIVTDTPVTIPAGWAWTIDYITVDTPGAMATGSPVYIGTGTASFGEVFARVPMNLEGAVRSFGVLVVGGVTIPGPTPLAIIGGAGGAANGSQVVVTIYGKQTKTNASEET